MGTAAYGGVGMGPGDGRSGANRCFVPRRRREGAYGGLEAEQGDTEGGLQRTNNADDHLADCSFVKYVLQQNLYKYILEKNSTMLQDGKDQDVRVASMALCVCHPTQETYTELKVPTLVDEVSKIVQGKLRGMIAD